MLVDAGLIQVNQANIFWGSWKWHLVANRQITVPPDGVLLNS